MTMTKKLDPTAEALQRLEEHLELPYVSGELQAWSETLCQLLSKAGEQVRTGIATEHGRAYETIVKSRSNLTRSIAGDGGVAASREVVAEGRGEPEGSRRMDRMNRMNRMNRRAPATPGCERSGRRRHHAST